MRYSSRLLASCSALALMACGSSTTSTPVPSDPFPGVAAALTIDLSRLPNYANPAKPVHYDNGLLATDNTPALNPVTDKGATLGRVLFYDKRLSINNNVSCASCHQQQNGFGDPDRFSLGFDGVGRTGAHSMRLLNARYYGAIQAFWDRRAASLEAQATQPIRNAIEMGFDDAHGGIDSLTRKMARLPYYPELFAFVFGDNAITEQRIQLAIAQFVRSLVSMDSRFDQAFAQTFAPQLPDRGLNAPFAAFTAQENRGKQLFLQPPPAGGAGCAGCHQPPTFGLAANSRSNGLDVGETVLFKSPSLKSVGAVGPYMHDGRFTTLDQVVEHYASGVQAGPALDGRLRGPGGAPLRLALSADDKLALVAFLRTLTDHSIATDPRFADPFRR